MLLREHDVTTVTSQPATTYLCDAVRGEDVADLFQQVNGQFARHDTAAAHHDQTQAFHLMQDIQVHDLLWAGTQEKVVSPLLWTHMKEPVAVIKSALI